MTRHIDVTGVSKRLDTLIRFDRRNMRDAPTAAILDSRLVQLVLDVSAPVPVATALLRCCRPQTSFGRVSAVLASLRVACPSCGQEREVLLRYTAGPPPIVQVEMWPDHPCR